MKTCYLLLLPLLAACDAAPEQAAKAEAPAVAPVAVAAHKASFDVPAALVGDVRELKKTLGKPVRTDQPTALQARSGAMGELEFVRDSTHLTLLFNPATHKVTEAFVAYTEPTANLDALLASGGLENNRLRYSLKPVKLLKDPSLYSGVTVTINRNIHP
jgi:hypothetical protein